MIRRAAVTAAGLCLLGLLLPVLLVGALLGGGSSPAHAGTGQSSAVDLGALGMPPVSGSGLVLGADGLARAPAGAPVAVAGAVAAANEISDRPYLEVHYPTHIGNPTYDCSSAVSHVLWGAGAFGTAPWTSGMLMSYGLPGPGRWITVYAHSGHAFVIVAGLRFDTASYDSGPNAGESGPRWRVGPRPVDGFVVRHPAGL